MVGEPERDGCKTACEASRSKALRNFAHPSVVCGIGKGRATDARGGGPAMTVLTTLAMHNEAMSSAVRAHDASQNQH